MPIAVAKRDAEPFFAELEIPRPRKLASPDLEAVKTLQTKGKAYCVPLNGRDGKILLKKFGSMASRARKKTRGSYCVRLTKVGVEPVVAVWRTA